MSAPQPILQDMPLHVKEIVLEKLGVKDRFKCRRINRSFKDLVDNMKVVGEVGELKIEKRDGEPQTLFIYFLEVVYRFSQNGADCVETKTSHSRGTQSTTHANQHYLDVAISALTKILKIKVAFQKFYLHFFTTSVELPDHHREFLEKFGEINDIPAGSVNADTVILQVTGEPEHFLAFIKIFNPRFIDCLMLHTSYHVSDRILDVSSIKNTELWKSAKDLKSSGWKADNLTFEDYRHCSKLFLRLVT